MSAHDAELDDLDYVEQGVEVMDVTQPFPYTADFGGIQDDEAVAVEVARFLAAVAPVNTRKEAIALGRSMIGDTGWAGLCQKFVRTCFATGPGFGSAGQQWRGADHRHPTDDYSSVPRGVPFFWDTSSPFEHVALTLGRDREGFRLCLSNDVFVVGRIDVVRMVTLADRWNCHPLGWTEDMNGKRVYNKPKPKPEPESPNWDLIVETARKIREGAKGDVRLDAQKIISIARPHSIKF